jgi:hypothetical protein
LTPEDDDATANLFSDDAPLRNAEEWLLRLDYAASKESAIQDEKRRRRDFVRDLLIDILPDVTDIEFTTPTTAAGTPGVRFRTPYGWVGLRQLGHGYRTLVAWMVDLASRLVDRYADLPNPLAGPAVVLVDEIDLHLHPAWQRMLPGHLAKCFPNAQFIVTAHSPLVVQAAGADANVVLLKREGDHVIIKKETQDVRGWRIDQLLTSDLFGLPSARAPQLDGLLARRQQLLTQPSLSEMDKQELAELERQIGPLPGGETAEDAKTKLLLDETIRLLRQHQEHGA